MVERPVCLSETGLSLSMSLSLLTLAARGQRARGDGLTEVLTVTHRFATGGAPLPQRRGQAPMERVILPS
jgi:hypothetical protein